MSSSVVSHPQSAPVPRKRWAKDAIDAYLGWLARLVVRARRPRVVGVTGSVGKTTTKDVIAAVLSHPDARPVVGTVFKTYQNLNNNRGLPLTVLGYRNWPSTRADLAWRLCVAPFRAMKLALVGPYPDVLVLEYAAADDSDMAWLVTLVRPLVAVVTAIGPAHLEYFRTVERIVEAKGALVRGVDPAGLVVVSGDNAYASGMDTQARARVVKVPGRGRALSENIAREVTGFFGVPDQTIETALPRRSWFAAGSTFTSWNKLRSSTIRSTRARCRCSWGSIRWPSGAPAAARLPFSATWRSSDRNRFGTTRRLAPTRRRARI